MNSSCLRRQQIRYIVAVLGGDDGLYVFVIRWKQSNLCNSHRMKRRERSLGI